MMNKSLFTSVRMMSSGSFKSGPSGRKLKGMLGDPAVYPLLAILTTGVAGATVFGIYTSFFNRDVRLNKQERNRLLREYAKQDTVSRFDDAWGNA